METKHSNWFAAGPEVQRALLLLSDGAFRLYLHICLSASRKSGRISLSYQDLAQTLGRSRRSIASHFDELRRLGICHMHPAVNQHRCTQIEVCDDFWPYTKTHCPTQLSPCEEYLAHIKVYLGLRACVRPAFTAADKRFASNLLTQQVPLERIERAIALACCRKYVSLLNGADSGPIVSFAYFRDVIEEVCNPEIPSGYWGYVMPELERLEKKWLVKQSRLAVAKSTSAAGPKNQETR